MTDTTEREILTLLADNLQQAAADCRLLAWHPRRGFVYQRFRRNLIQVAGCCEQAFYWRNYDARWLVLAELAVFVLHRCGAWLRGPHIIAADGRGIWTGGSIEHRNRAQPEFAWLADKLAALHHDMERIRDMATGRFGPILPPVLEGPHRDTRPTQVMLPIARDSTAD